MTLEQVAHLLELLQNEPEDMRCMITLLLYTGLRRSELLGLEWKDIDFQAGLLSIRRTSQYVAGKGVFTDETKTYPAGFSSLQILRSLCFGSIMLCRCRIVFAWATAGRNMTGSLPVGMVRL